MADLAEQLLLSDSSDSEMDDDSVLRKACSQTMPEREFCTQPTGATCRWALLSRLTTTLFALVGKCRAPRA